MKKIMNLVIGCIFAVTIFSGCGATNTNNNTKSNTNSNTKSKTSVNTIGNTNGNINNSGMAAQ